MNINLCKPFFFFFFLVNNMLTLAKPIDIVTLRTEFVTILSLNIWAFQNIFLLIHSSRQEVRIIM